MLNLLNLNQPLIANGKPYASSQAAYEALKDFQGEVTITIPSRQEEAAVSTEPEENVTIGETGKEYRIRVKKWMTEHSSPGFDFMEKWNNDIPMPLVIMRGQILEETKGMVKMELHATPEPSSVCFKCGRVLTHPVSLLYGLGPECGGHFHINPLASKADLDGAMEQLKEKMGNIKWTGWVIKSAIREMNEISVDDRGYKEGA